MKILNLNVSSNGHSILKNINFDIKLGKTHVIIGMNGSGKTTLAHSIVKKPHYEINGSIYYKDENLLDLDVHEIALRGIYLAPQYPASINGLSHAAFLKAAINAKRNFLGQEEVDDLQFLKDIKQLAQQFSLYPEQYTRRSLNDGFSGGEKKRNEILQISLLQPEVIILDEVDSGVDLDSQKTILDHLTQLKSQNKTLILITHQPAFAKSLGFDYLHLMKNGEIFPYINISEIDNLQQHGFGAINV